MSIRLAALMKSGSLHFPEDETTFGWVLEHLQYHVGRRTIGGINKRDLRGYGISLPLALIYVAVTSAVFISLLTVQVNNQRHQKFLSLVNNESSLVCSEVPLSLTETHYATFNGVWDTRPNYVVNQSYFSLSFDNAELSTSQYRDAISKFRDAINAVGVTYSRKVLILNLLALCVFEIDVPQLQFSTSVDATYIFNGDVKSALISSREGSCVGKGSALISGFYDPGSFSLTLSLPLAMDVAYLGNIFQNSGSLSPSLMTNFPCARQWGGKLVDYDTEWISEYRDGSVDFAYDVRAVIAAIAMNLGVYKEYSRVQDNVYAGFIGFIDTWFEDGMEPFWCLDKSYPAWKLTPEQKSGPDICFVSSNNHWPFQILYYPVISQLTPTTEGHKDGEHRLVSCKCDSNASGGKEIWHSYFCLHNNFELGLIFGTSSHRQEGDDDANVLSFVNQEVVTIGKRVQKFLIDDPKDGDSAALLYFSNMLAYSINVQREPAISNQSIESYSSSAGVWIDNSWARGMSYDELLAEEWKKICSNCSAMIFEVTGSHALNKFSLRLDEVPRENKNADSPACQDIFSQSAAFDRMLKEPPVKLVNSFFSCQKTLLSILTSTVGSAIAATVFITTVVWVTAGYAAVWALKRRLKASGQQILTEDKKTQVLEAYEELKDDCLLSHLQSSKRVIDALSKELAHLQAEVSGIKGAAKTHRDKAVDDSLAALGHSLQQLQGVHHVSDSTSTAKLTAKHISSQLLSQVEKEEGETPTPASDVEMAKVYSRDHIPRPSSLMVDNPLRLDPATAPGVQGD